MEVLTACQPRWFPALSTACEPVAATPRSVRRGALFFVPRMSAAKAAERALDVQLLARTAAGEEAAFAALYDRFAPGLFSMIVKMTHDEKEAEDVLQEGFAHIWRRAATYDAARSSPFTWAVMILRNKAIDRLRALRRRYIFIGEITSEAEEQSPDVRSASGPDDVFNPDQAALVRSAVATLPLEQRQAIEMAFLGGMTQNEIAESLRQPLGTIKARIRRGMLKLRQSLRPLL